MKWIASPLFLCGLVAFIASSVSAGPVTLSESPEYYTLANGVLTAKVDKSNGNLFSLLYNGTEILNPSELRTMGFWSHSASSPDMLRKVTIDPKTNNGQRAEVSVKGIS